MKRESPESTTFAGTICNPTQTISVGSFISFAWFRSLATPCVPCGVRRFLEWLPHLPCHDPVPSLAQAQSRPLAQSEIASPIPWKKIKQVSAGKNLDAHDVYSRTLTPDYLSTICINMYHNMSIWFNMSNAVLKVVRSHQAVGGADLEIRGPSNGFQGHPDSIKPATCPPWTSEPRTLRMQRATWENRKVWEKWGLLCRGMVGIRDGFTLFFWGGKKKRSWNFEWSLGQCSETVLIDDWLMINCKGFCHPIYIAEKQLLSNNQHEGTKMGFEHCSLDYYISHV